jgi:predicted metal-dependent peptidase
VLPSHFGLPDNKLAEWYFAERLKALAERAGGGLTQENGGRGDGGRGRAGRGDGKGDGTQIDYGCGSGASGIEAPWDVGSPEASGVDGLDDADAWDIRRQVAKDVVAFQARGNAPLGLLTWAKELTKVKTIPWDSLLVSAVRRASLTAAGATIPSYARPSRRQHAFGRAIAPAYRHPVPSIVAVTDTSDSMSALRATVRGVIDSACRRLGVPLRVIDVDAAVQRDVLVSSGRLTTQKGGGGTDMRVGIERAMERGGCDAVVVVTDCETLWPTVKTRAKLIVVAVGATAEALKTVPSWATLIKAEAA